MSKKKLVFSGVQPTGNLHLGNYLGALKNFVSLQKEMECIYCVVDLHAITVFQDPNQLHDNVLETTAGFLARGLDPSKINSTPLKFNSCFTKGILILFSSSFLNSSVPIVDNVFSDKNFKESGLGVVSVCIIKVLYYIRPTFSRIFLRFSSAIILAFSVPFFRVLFRYDLSLSNF